MQKPSVLVISVVLLLGAVSGVVAEDADSRPAIPSAGCGGSQVEPGTLPREHLTVRGVEKDFALHVPEAHDGPSPLPLWIQLHGSGQDGATHIVRLRSSADEHGFVLAAPTELIGNAGWTWREADPELDASLSNPDIAFVDGLIEHLAGELCLDLARVYVAGYSGGGEGASVLMCVLEDKIAAVSPAAAMLDVGDACELDRPVPFLAIHGTADASAYFDGGYSPGYNEFAVVQALAQTTIPERVTNVALRNGCEPQPSVDAVDAIWERWAWSCSPGAEVELLVHDGGHNAGPTGTTDIIWEFFEQHPMPE